MQMEKNYLQFVNLHDPVSITGRQLPHWQQGECVQFVTFRLADSLPQSRLDEMRVLREDWLSHHPRPWSRKEEQEYADTVSDKLEQWTDAGYGECLLQEERVRRVVAEAIGHFHGSRYQLHAFVIMPNHVHVLLSPLAGYSVQDIVGSWKVYSARAVNRLLHRSGPLWERACFDHMVRNADSFREKLDYILRNPRHLPLSTYTLVVV